MTALSDELRAAPLGHATGYPDTYDAALLFPVPRAPQREEIGIGGALPFAGADVWTAFELTWLDPHGKPAVAIASFEVPATSPAIVESKSVKLYLGLVRAVALRPTPTAVSAVDRPGPVARRSARR